MTQLDLGPYANRIIATRQIPPRPGRWVDLPAELHPTLRQALQALGIDTLYAHQAEAFVRSRRGEHVVLTTGTASGKSLAYLLPVLQQVLEEPASRAILLFPTKALGQDQLRGLLELLRYVEPGGVTAGVYDGDTPPDERTRIREGCNLILTNPDMLNSGFLPNHGRRGFSHIFRNVRHLVLDELHTYRGAFGAHFANLLRRLRRVCDHYGSAPRILASSATIANPAELAETLCGVPCSLIEEDGSPAAGKTVHFWLPPETKNGLRRGVVQEMAGLLPRLVAQRQRFIAFCRSRKETEIVLKESRDALGAVDGGHDERELIAGYRGGYTPEERRTVARKLHAGELLGVVSTNALELGVDIGALEVVVQAGFPGTRASFWQQLGRAGRRERESQAIVLLAMAPLDQFIGGNPEWLLARRGESAVLDPDNLLIQLAHVRAAAAELPLTLADVRCFPDLGEVIPVLQEAGELRAAGGCFHWTGGPYPAGDFSLRNIDGDRYKIVNRQTGSTITEMDRPQTYKEAFPRAVYLHDGQQYLVETLDHVGRVATVVQVEQNYYTEPDVRTKIDVLLVQKDQEIGRTRAFFGDVRVDGTTVGYKMLQFHNHQNLGYEVLEPPLTVQLETEALWLPLPDDVHQQLAGLEQDTVAGLVHALVSCGRLATMAERTDLQGSSFHFMDPQSGRTSTALILHDSHPGGLGFAARAFEEIATLLPDALRLVERCACHDGCPACVGAATIDRSLVAWGLRSLLQETPPPTAVPGLPHLTAAERLGEPPLAIPWAEVPARWEEVRQRLASDRSPGAAALRQVTAVRTLATRLILQIDSPGLVAWLEGDSSKLLLERTLRRHLQLPEGCEVQSAVAAAAQEARQQVAHKLRRRLDDLLGRT
ncbi:MAG: DEAD/DEAH box helicase [Myxococcota bacterium]|jgi:DEAD/DEAH box helicase domain-containing protein|nr:DEAD/DEAH box helicase [Myxococcota bacterium]